MLDGEGKPSPHFFDRSLQKLSSFRKCIDILLKEYYNLRRNRNYTK